MGYFKLNEKYKRNMKIDIIKIQFNTRRLCNVDNTNVLLYLI